MPVGGEFLVIKWSGEDRTWYFLNTRNTSYHEMGTITRYELLGPVSLLLVAQVILCEWKH